MQSKLNNIDNNVLTYLSKHRIYDKSVIENFNDYVKSRELGINFYGFKLNGTFLVQTFLVIFNFILPILYALFANKLIYFFAQNNFRPKYCYQLVELENGYKNMCNIHIQLFELNT